VPAVTGPEEAYKLVSTLLSDAFGVDPVLVEPGASLADLGLDSLGAVELFDILQERTMVRFETDEADLALTVAELADRISGSVTAATSADPA
jgi:acyl carrier protein